MAARGDLDLYFVTIKDIKINTVIGSTALPDLTTKLSLVFRKNSEIE